MVTKVQKRLASQPFVGGNWQTQGYGTGTSYGYPLLQTSISNVPTSGMPYTTLATSHSPATYTNAASLLSPS